MGISRVDSSAAPETINDSSAEETVTKHREFVRRLVALTAGGPPASDLCDAIESTGTGTVNYDAVFAMLTGFPFKSYTADPDPPQFPSSRN
jgi:hypothetical protein